MNLNQQPTLILFDIDGTLLTLNGAGRAASDLALQELLGLTRATDGISFAGSTDLLVLEQVLRPLGFTTDAIAALLLPFAESMARHLAQILGEFEVRSLPGTLELVAALAHDPRARLGLVTGNAWHTVPIKLRAAGFDPDHFPVGAYGHESANRNDLPPLAVQRAREYWQVDFAPERIVVVGDTPSDVICTRSVKGRAVAVLTGHASHEVLVKAAPFAILEDLTDRLKVEAVLFGEV